jgi:transcriptional regulator with XRE-family HTH domain
MECDVLRLAYIPPWHAFASLSDVREQLVFESTGVRFPRARRRMKRPFSIYLRTYRKKFGLTQREAALLVGMETGQIVSRHESKLRTPSFKTAIAYQIVFDVPLRALFPEIYHEVEMAVLGRAEALQMTLKAERDTTRTKHKLRRLEEMIKMIESPDV